MFTPTAVFSADRDTDGMVKVSDGAGVEIGQIFLPDTSTNEGLRRGSLTKRSKSYLCRSARPLHG